MNAEFDPREWNDEARRTFAWNMLAGVLVALAVILLNSGC
jgi:hypothetical protein